MPAWKPVVRRFMLSLVAAKYIGYRDGIRRRHLSNDFNC